ncbi:LacI family DNA-binding transcriptional regulator [Acerihabitans sp.]|uniref:LacI family DNA-binding transcriptional regulator n=1 Tax=Acerihabitans sp. TaxID=2811394 RepID=UPI002EDA6D41
MKKAPQRRVTIVDVAKRAGVSKSTVARVLAGASNVSEAASERVLRVASDAGYERNHLAVGMRSGRSGLLGMVIPDITNPFWAQVARGAQDRAAREDMSLLVFSSDWDAGKESMHLRAIRQARVDGAIINPVADNFDDLGRFGLPFVFIGSSSERFPDSSSVGSDIAQAVRLGMDLLAANGHPTPALILGPRARLARARFLQTVHDHCVERDIDPAALQMEDAEYTVTGGKLAMSRLLERRGKTPMAVFAANDLMALGAMIAVREAGLRCPQDISILGFDGIPAGEFSWPGLTTIEKPGRQIGENAVECLLEEIAGRPKGRIYMPCRLIKRDSVCDLSVPAPIGAAAGR